MSEIWGIPSPYKSGAQKHLFGPTSQRKGNFNGLYLRKEGVGKYKGLPTWSENFVNFGPQTA